MNTKLVILALLVVIAVLTGVIMVQHTPPHPSAAWPSSSAEPFKPAVSPARKKQRKEWIENIDPNDGQGF